MSKTSHEWNDEILRIEIYYSAIHDQIFENAEMSLEGCFHFKLVAWEMGAIGGIGDLIDSYDYDLGLREGWLIRLGRL